MHSIIYRHFYKFSTPATLLRLYTTLVRPILEYSSLVWSPYSASLSHSLESIALKLTSKFGTALPSLPPPESKITPLSICRQHSYYLKFKIFHSHSYFPIPILQRWPCPCTLLYPILPPKQLSTLSLSANPPYYLKSLSPSAIRLWNSLSPYQKISSLSIFACTLLNFLTNN